jgi:beta-lactamase regulating signal transducer with metallopeptidase domain
VPAASSATSFGPAQGVFGNDSVPRLVVGSESNIPRWLTIVRFLWIAGSVIFALPLAVDLWRLRRLRRDWLPWPELRQPALALAAERGVRHRVGVLLHEEIPAPLTCGLWHPAMALPWDARDWKEAELRRSLVHELEHVRRRDWAVHLAARATCAFYWFHPLVWVAWRRLCLEAERACDDAVIQKEDGTEYAGQLISLARRMSTVQARPALGMANRSDLARRVSAILDHRQRRGRAEILAAASIVICATLAVLAIAPIHAVAQSSGVRGSSRLNRALYCC